MKKGLFVLNSIIAVLGTMGVAVAKAMGGWDATLQVLVALVAVDYASGLTVAIVEKKLDSNVGFRGIMKKVFIFALVYLAVLIDKTISTDFIRTLTVTFYIANESISILENAGKLGVPYPKKLKEVLVQLKKSTEDKADGNNKA